MYSVLIATIAMCVSLATLTFQVFVYWKSVGRVTTESILTADEIQKTNSLQLIARNRGRVAISVSGLCFRADGHDDIHILLAEHDVVHNWHQPTTHLEIRKTPRLDLPPGGVDTMFLLAGPIALAMKTRKWTTMPESVALITGAGYSEITLPDAFRTCLNEEFRRKACEQA